MLIDTLNTQYDNAVNRNWDKIFIAADIHSTAIRSNYLPDVLPKDFYPLAKETLAMLSKRCDVCLILSTCSWPEEIEKYLVYFKECGIDFKHVNKNDDVVNDRLGYFNDKYYLNVGLDDKYGFLPEDDWRVVYDFFKDRPELSKK